LRKLPLERFALDGEIVVEDDFELLLRRLHPAASRVERLSVETPASDVAFDVLAHGPP
jgi:ATP-dependent DNA ligase